MEKILKKKLINEYKEGDEVKDIFVVKFKKGVADYVNGYSFSLVLTDSSGKSIDYKYWGGNDETNVKALYDKIKDDSVIYMEGKVSSYKNKPQIGSNEGIHSLNILEKGQYDEQVFIKKTKKDIEKMYAELQGYVDGVQDEKIKILLKNILLEVGDSFKKQPAAISIHHNWIGGLLEHILEILKYCDLSVKLYPELNRDLLVAGAMLHDIGKIEEMEMTSRIKGTNTGQFVGHLILGSIFVSKKMDELGVDNQLKDKILHMIVSHHGKIDKGSPKEPMFPEAVVLHYADELSSKTVEMLNFIKDNREETEDDFMPKWDKNRPNNIFLR
ncbi:MAG: HD domain-containing protein [Nanoarchaeota archaeon]